MLAIFENLVVHTMLEFLSEKKTLIYFQNDLLSATFLWSRLDQC